MTLIPEAVRTGVEAALRERHGTPVAITGTRAVGGGSISPTARVDTGRGSYFLKWSGADLPAGLLPAEARGLRQLAGVGEVRIPGVVADSDAETEWLLLEWLEPGAPGASAWRRLGRELAALHRHRGHRFGADSGNFIGSLPQANEPEEDWAVFWRDRRLTPQLLQARDRGLLDSGDQQRFDRLFDRLDEILEAAGDEGPSLLHGDLWSGNVHMVAGDGLALIDPSVYHGHREVDLAMAELFGGFGPGFMDAYREAWPLQPGYAPTRRAIYQLYYLLVHVNLFGSGYVQRTRSALAAAGAG